MMGFLVNLFQEGAIPGGIPETGVRLSIWFIVMFLLAVGGALVVLRIQELKKKAGDSENY